jgi:hypothetical protein
VRIVKLTLQHRTWTSLPVAPMQHTPVSRLERSVRAAFSPAQAASVWVQGGIRITTPILLFFCLKMLRIPSRLLVSAPRERQVRSRTSKFQVFTASPEPR